MEISIIIATHNEGAALASTLESCTDTCAGMDYEIVVADDASTDGSADKAQQRFPLARFVRHARRRGASPAKALGASHARGDVLVFLDAHTRPEPGAVARLASLVAGVGTPAIITPAVAALDTGSWRADHGQIGHGYAMDLTDFGTEWIPVSQMRRVETPAGPLLESPALIGCAFAISRTLYDRLWGFDAGMRSWGLEDLDLGLKCWQAGHSILHDPDTIIAHRFQADFSHYTVPAAHVLANKMRMARKNFTEATWDAWIAHQRAANGGPLAGHPEGLWAHAWQLLMNGRTSLEQEREFLHGHRARDEFGFAARFGLDWPLLRGQADDGSAGRAVPSPRPSGSPSPSPSPAPAAVDIQVNNTPVTTDDLVLLPCLDPGRQPVPVLCRIKQHGKPKSPLTVTLTDPTGRLRFLPPPTGNPAALPRDAVTGSSSLTLTLPVPLRHDPGFIGFRIVGQTASVVKGDAIIRATRQDGTVAGTLPVTVVSFAGNLTLTPNGTYALIGRQLTPLNGANAVDFEASAVVRPPGVDCQAPQLKPIIDTFRVAFMQNVRSKRTAVFYRDPEVTFRKDIAPGTVAVIPAFAELLSAFAVPLPVNDGVNDDPAPFPLYALRNPSLPSDIDPTLARIRCGADQESTALSNDTPHTPFASRLAIDLTEPQPGPQGQVITLPDIGKVIWKLSDATQSEDFTTFCATVDPTSQQSRLATFCALRQGRWRMNVSVQANAGPSPANRVSVTQQNAPATEAPVTTGATANHSPRQTRMTFSAQTVRAVKPVPAT